MNNFLQEGEVLTGTAPSGGVVSGQGILMDALFGVVAADAAAGEDFEMKVTGCFRLPKAAGAWTFGQPIYWDAGNEEATTGAPGNTSIGVCSAKAGHASDDAYGDVRLQPGAFEAQT